MEESFSPFVAGFWLMAITGFVVVYYVFLGKTVLDMLRGGANQVLLTFSLIAMIPFPPLAVMGVVLMIVWAIHRREAKEMPAAKSRPSRR